MEQITTAQLAKLFETTPQTIATPGRNGIIVPAGKRWAVAPTPKRHWLCPASP
jgi:hypothetical protein